jgi:hypothetical protein
MTPTEITRFVALVVPEPLDQEVAKDWYHCVVDKAPYGIVSVMQTTTDKGGLKSVSMVHRETDKKHYYMIPITRDLLEREAENIVDAFSEDHPDVDFDIEATIMPTRFGDKKEPKIDVDKEEYLTLCAEFSKTQHEKWVRDHADDGWRYGVAVDPKEKTHPLMRSWDQLPDRHKKIDTDVPQKLLDLLSRHGYAVVQQSDLDAVMRLLRQKGA